MASAVSVDTTSKYTVIKKSMTDYLLNVGLSVSSSNGHIGSFETYYNNQYYNTNPHGYIYEQNSYSNSPKQPYYVLKSSEYDSNTNSYDKIYLGQVRQIQDAILSSTPSGSNYPLLFNTTNNSSLLTDKYLYIYGRNAIGFGTIKVQIVGGKFLIKLYGTKTFS